MDTSSNRIVLPVAGGKGGVGKSIVCANLAVAFAEAGKRVVVADLDLGGSNLHSYLGVNNRLPGLGEFVSSGSQEIDEYLYECEPGLRFLTGGISPFMANITWHQKRKIVKAIRRVEADVILLDLGAGTSFNTLDFFSLSDRGVLVTNPDIVSVVSMLGFLKNFLFRYILQESKKERDLNMFLDRLIKSDTSGRQLTIDYLKEKSQDRFGAVPMLLDEVCSRVRPVVIFNRAANVESFSITKQFSRGMRTVLSLEADYYGYIFEDRCADKALKLRKNLVKEYPDSVAGTEFRKIADRLSRYYDRFLPNSAQLLEDALRCSDYSETETRSKSYISASPSL